MEGGGREEREGWEWGVCVYEVRGGGRCIVYMYIHRKDESFA